VGIGNQGIGMMRWRLDFLQFAIRAEAEGKYAGTRFGGDGYVQGIRAMRQLHGIMVRSAEPLPRFADAPEIAIVVFAAGEKKVPAIRCPLTGGLRGRLPSACKNEMKNCEWSGERAKSRVFSKGAGIFSALPPSTEVCIRFQWPPSCSRKKILVPSDTIPPHSSIPPALVMRVMRCTLGRGMGYTMKKSSHEPKAIAQERRLKSIHRAACPAIFLSR